MKNAHFNNQWKIKKRKPLMAAFLSLISMGLGQVYNGEWGKGLVLNLIFWVTFLWYGWYTASAYFGQSYDLVFFLILVAVFLLTKIYSIIQAGMVSRKEGASYRLKPVNKWYFYVLFALFMLIPPLLLNNVIRDHSICNTSSPHPFRSKKARKEFLQLYERRANHWPVPSETRTVETSSGQTFVRISGSNGNPPLVLLHGGPSNSLQWIPNIEELSQEYRTYAVDIIFGTGRSVNTKEIKTSTQLVEWLDETLTVLGLSKKIHLVGLSYGGWIASQYALQHQARLNKLVLIAPAGTVAPLSSEWITHALLSLIPHRYFIKSFLYWNLPDFAIKDQLELDRHVDESFLAMRCFKSRSLVNPTLLTGKQWQSMRIPTLLLLGENERIYSENIDRIIQKLKGIHPRIHIKIISGAGHDLTFVRTKTVNRAILQFLNQTGK